VKQDRAKLFEACLKLALFPVTSRVAEMTMPIDKKR
jgi:hypothetical protein